MASIGKTGSESASTRSFWSADQFRAWQDAVGLSGQKAAAALGVSDNSVSNYRQRGCPKTIALACIAIYGRQEEAVKPWARAA
jgi:hypothetical protein